MTNMKEIDHLKENLRRIESRIVRLERIVSGAQPGESPDSENETGYESVFKTGKGSFESHIGEYGMAWLSNIVIFFGILFLLQLFKSRNMDWAYVLIGYISVAGIYVLGRFLSKPNPYMSGILIHNGYLLLYIVTLRLYFATNDPILGSKTVVLLIIFLMIAVFIYMTFRNRSQVIGSFVILMMTTTGVLSGNTHVMLSLLVMVAASALVFLIRFGWKGTFFLSIVLVYISFLLWFFNNPVYSLEFKVVSSLQFSYIYLIICALLYSIVALLPLKDRIVEGQINGSIIVNGLGFSLMLTLISIHFFQENFYIITGLVAAVSVAFSILLQSKKMHRLSGALYGLYGFALLSITLSGLFKFPLVYLLLAVESLLVLSMALWYSSRFIVVVNLLLYTALMVAQFKSQANTGSISLSFAAVALISARIINWQKERLNIRTEWIRNTYLFLGFITTLSGLYYLVPAKFISFSWAISAAVFFIISLVMKNVKYRWLAIGAMLSSAIYFFIRDFKEANTGYRIVALMVIAAISLGFSLYYARKKHPERSASNKD